MKDAENPCLKCDSPDPGYCEEQCFVYWKTAHNNVLESLHTQLTRAQQLEAMVMEFKGYLSNRLCKDQDGNNICEELVSTNQCFGDCAIKELIKIIEPPDDD